MCDTIKAIKHFFCYFSPGLGGGHTTGGGTGGGGGGVLIDGVGPSGGDYTHGEGYGAGGGGFGEFGYDGAIILDFM